MWSLGESIDSDEFKLRRPFLSLEMVHMIYVQEFYTQLCVFTHCIGNRSTYSMNTMAERTSELMGTGVLAYDFVWIGNL